MQPKNRFWAYGLAARSAMVSCPHAYTKIVCVNSRIRLAHYLSTQPIEYREKYNCIGSIGCIGNIYNRSWSAKKGRPKSRPFTYFTYIKMVFCHCHQTLRSHAGDQCRPAIRQFRPSKGWFGRYSPQTSPDIRAREENGNVWNASILVPLGCHNL